MNAIDLLLLLSSELDDSISFMELFDNGDDEGRLQRKHEALEKVNAFLKENQK